jgi:nucleoside-diphosphate-sugar epimerase
MSKFAENRYMILVTGGSGLLGSHLILQLCQAGHRVRVLKRPSTDEGSLRRIFSYYSNNAEYLLSLVEWKEAALDNIYSLLEALEGITEIYHCAAMVSFEKKKHAQMLQVNVEGTANLVNAALEKGIRKFCHVSSIAALGRTEHGEPVDETIFWKSSPSNSVYSISKYGAEREVWRASEEGLDVIIVNPSLVIGPGSWTESTCNMFSRGYEGIRHYTKGTTGFVDVRDVATLMIRLMQSTHVNERYIISGENNSYKLFFDEMHKNFGKKLPASYAGPFLSDLAWRVESVRCAITGKAPLITRETARAAQSNTVFSNEKIKKAFPDFKFRSLEESVRHTCKIFLADISARS